MIILVSILFMLSSINLFAAKYAGEIFRIGAGVRNFATGNTGITNENSPALAYWNSALLAKSKINKIELMHAEEYMGLLTFDTASVIWGNENKFSFVLTRIGINDIPLTRLIDENSEPDSLNRPYKYKTVNNSDFVAYFGFTRKIGNYNIGFTPKIANRHLAEENGFGFGADISTYFEFSKLIIGLKIRDFFTTQILWGNGTHEIVNPGFDLEANLGFKIPVFKIPSRLFTALESYSENRSEAAAFSVGFFSFDPHLGLEMYIHPKVDLFAGYDINNFTSGVSVSYGKLDLNYALEFDADDLDNSHRMSISLNL